MEPVPSDVTSLLKKLADGKDLINSATPIQIDELKKNIHAKLNIEIPPEYIDFLNYTNGFTVRLARQHGHLVTAKDQSFTKRMRYRAVTAGMIRWIVGGDAEDLHENTAVPR